jgi:hypothetical protein
MTRRTIEDFKLQNANFKLQIEVTMHSLRYKILIGGYVALVLSVAQLRAADEPSEKAKPASSLDRQLLEGLDNALLEGLDEAPNKSTKATTSDPKATNKLGTPAGNSPLDEDLLRELGGDHGEDIGVESAQQDPLVGIGRRMRNVQSRLNDQKLDDGTSQMQKRILDDLAALLQECKNCQGGGNGKPGSKSGKGSQGGKSPAAQAPSDTARNSSDKLKNRQTERGDSGALTSAMKESWGNLPEHVREHLGNVTSDAFLPKYELMLEKYFKRLGESNAAEQ